MEGVHRGELGIIKKEGSSQGLRSPTEAEEKM